MFDFIVRSQPIADHLAPVWRNLPAALKGAWVCTENVADYCRSLNLDIVALPGDPTSRGRVKVSEYLRGRPGFCVCAYFGDLRCSQDADRESVLFEHGTGQRYKGHRKRGWEGKLPNNQGVRALLSPNEYWAGIRRQTEPTIPVHVVGTPKLDRYVAWRKERTSPPTVAISFRWKCQVCPECTGSFEYWQRYLPYLLEHWQVLGHVHPQMWGENKVLPWYESVGIEPVKHFDEVLRRADLYSIDNSSTLFEFAATNRPVLVLNPPTYRRDVHHGLRFWEFADVGVNCDGRKQLVAKVGEALEDPERVRRRRKEVSSILFPHLGNATQRAVEVLAELAGSSRPRRSGPPAIAAGQVRETQGLPACRCRGEQLPSGRYACSSKHLVAPHGVSATTCRACPFVDRVDDPRARRRQQQIAQKPPAPPVTAPRACKHLGRVTGETHLCGTCAGKVKIKVRSCALHTKCTTAKELPGIACCATCPDLREN